MPSAEDKQQPKKDTTAKAEPAPASEPAAKLPAKPEPKAEAPPGKPGPAKPEPPAKPPPKERPLTEPQAFLKEALAAARHLEVDRLLMICDEAGPLELLIGRGVKKKAVLATSSEKQHLRCEELGLAHVAIPPFAFDRLDKIKVALSASQSAGSVADGDLVLCLVGRPGSPETDTSMLTRVGQHSEEQSALGALIAGGEVSPQVLDAVLQMALSVGFDGIEGTPVGTILVVGDSTAIMEKSKQLTLNPFQGYSEDDRNILDPKIRDAVRNFCLLDGAIVVREDGVLLAAGRYLRPPETLDIDLPMGQGTRHAAAKAITQVTHAVAFVVSKTTGAVSIYRAGGLVVEIKQPRRRT
ncbi:MAG TPA: DNA integrity scanning protein DisA nucleotide-binding domain protein [Myxococcota bacterium]|nr:DNA integrity scanning protein DisA nucleotide-binding domain protein [Myxococcota bacterium]HRY92564.1 DNA integrity scanning protein DisA nucleotide-binding domain protein [Myxococcota bacterium]HSA24509.1 DNA integrity scanning protein DisA nucleotide-binding domain protein [Myxococcota bacterium]